MVFYLISILTDFNFIYLQASESDLLSTNNNKGMSVLTNLSSTLPLRNAGRMTAAVTSSVLCHGYEDYDEVAEPCDDIVLPPTGHRYNETLPTRISRPPVTPPPDTPSSTTSSASLPSRYRSKSRSFRTLHRVLRGLRRTQSQGDDDDTDLKLKNRQLNRRLRSQQDLGTSLLSVLD